MSKKNVWTKETQNFAVDSLQKRKASVKKAKIILSSLGSVVALTTIAAVAGLGIDFNNYKKWKESIDVEQINLKNLKDKVEKHTKEFNYVYSQFKNDAVLIEILDPVKDSFDKQKNNILVEI